MGRYVGGLYTELFYAIILLVSMLFADLLSLYLVTFLMFFILVTIYAAGVYNIEQQ